MRPVTATLLLAAPVAGFQAHSWPSSIRGGLSSGKLRFRRSAPAPLQASLEAVDVLQNLGAHLDGFSAHAAVALDSLTGGHNIAAASLLDDSSTMSVADAAAMTLDATNTATLAVDASDQGVADVANAAVKKVVDTRSAGAIADEKALAEGGIHPWRAWRSFIQGSIVATHDTLVNVFGVKENAYGFAIIFFTIALRLVVSPLTFIQTSSSERMKAMQPYMEQIKERYKNDPQMQNIMTAKLYEDTDSNPLLGCLPAFLQIPVFIALYRSILNLANDKLLEEPFFFVPSLEGPTLTEKLQLPQGRGMDWLTSNWVGEGSTPSFFGGDLEPLLGWSDTAAYLALPACIVIAQYITQALITPPVDESLDEETKAKQKRAQGILKYLPWLTGSFALQVPAALGLYWLTSNVCSAASTTAVRVSIIFMWSPSLLRSFSYPAPLIVYPNQAYLNANPPSVDWDFLEKSAPKAQVAGSAFQLQMPANMDEAIADARLNARPPRISRITSGVAAVNAEIISSSTSAAGPAVEDILAAEN